MHERLYTKTFLICTDPQKWCQHIAGLNQARQTEIDENCTNASLKQTKNSEI